MMGSPAWLQDPKWWEPGVGARVELLDEFNVNFLPWILERGKREIWTRGACGESALRPAADH